MSKWLGSYRMLWEEPLQVHGGRIQFLTVVGLRSWLSSGGRLSSQRPLSYPLCGPLPLCYMKSISCLKFLCLLLLWHLLSPSTESSLL